jgi:glucose/arabinose dehydrogenase
MMSSRSSQRGLAREGTPRARRIGRPGVEPLEARQLLTGSPPFAVGGDPIVHPTDFRVTTFASGLNYPHGMMTLSDGSLLVAVNNPNNGGVNFFDTTGELLRFTDANHDGVADNPAGSVLYNGLPGEVTAVKQAGHYIVATSSQAGSERISFLHRGLTPADPLTLVGSINFSFPNPAWDHTTFALAVRPTPGQPGNFDVFFNIGSEFNGVVIGDDGQVVLDQNGIPTFQPTVDPVQASGLLSTTLIGDSIYMVTVHDVRGTPRVSNLTRIASGLRNAASMAIDPTTGDLWFADNGIDGNDGGNEAWSTDELDRIPAAQIGGAVEFFGFPTLVNGHIVYSYVKTIDKPGDPVMVLNPNVGVQPVVAFEPLPDPVLTVEGSESEGSSGFALSPSQFPAGLNHGVFVGFHGLFDQGGIANDENPMVFADPSTGHYFDFISNNLPNIGHLDEILSTNNSLFVADISSTGELFGASGVGAGVIYQIEAVAAPTTAVSIGAHSLKAAATQVHQGMGDLSWTKSKAAAPVTGTVQRRASNLIHEIDAPRSHRHRKPGATRRTPPP